MLVQSRKSNKFRFIEARDFPSDAKIIHAGEFIGGKLNYSNDQLILIAATQADGSFNAIGALRFTLKKERKITRLKQALDNLNIEYKLTARKAEGFFDITIHQSNVPEWLQDKKFFGDWILQLEYLSFRFLADEIFKWDGCNTRNNMYSSSVKSNTDWAQILIMLSGKRAKVREYFNGNPNAKINYQIDVVNKNNSMTTNFTSMNTYSDENAIDVFCVTVPSGMILVRQNGKALVVGNCQNAPSHSGEYGKKFKRIIAADPGRVILNFDWTGFHALMLGYFAEDKDYMRLSRYGVHDYLAGFMLINILNQAQGNIKSSAWKECRGDMYYLKEGEEYEKELINLTEKHISDLPLWLTYEDAILNSKLKTIKKLHKYLRDKKSKPICHSIGFAAQPKGIYDKNEDSFKNISEVEQLSGLYFDTFPAIKKYQFRIGKQAYQDKKLVSPYGYVRRFYDAMVMTNGVLSKGEQFSEAVAYFPANSAFGVKKENMLDLEDIGANERFCFFNEVHDSLMFHPRESDVTEAIKIVYGIMTAPVKLLSHPLLCPDGLVCDAEISVGPNWGELEEVKL